MANNPMFPFDPAAMTEFFKAADPSKFMSMPKVPGIDPSEFMDTQKKNMDAFVSANKAAADAYQDLFRKQVEIFQSTLEEAQKHVSDVPPSDVSAEAAQKHMSYAQEAVNTAMAHMNDFAEEARKANSEAFETVQKRAAESAQELQKLAEKLKP